MEITLQRHLLHTLCVYTVHVHLHVLINLIKFDQIKDGVARGVSLLI